MSNIHIIARKSALIGPEYSPPLTSFIAVAEPSVYWRKFAGKKFKINSFQVHSTLLLEKTGK